MAKKVKCRYCGKEIEKESAYNPSPRIYYCDKECCQKHEKRKSQRRKYANKFYDNNNSYDIELNNSLQYVSTILTDINKPMVRNQLSKMVKSGFTYKGIELTINYIINIKGLQFDSKYGIIYLVQKYYVDAKRYWLSKQNIKKKINSHTFESNVNVMKVNGKNNKLKSKLKAEEF